MGFLICVVSMYFVSFLRNLSLFFDVCFSGCFGVIYTGGCLLVADWMWGFGAVCVACFVVFFFVVWGFWCFNVC